MIQTIVRTDPGIAVPAGHDATGPHTGGGPQAGPTPRIGGPTVHDPTGPTSRFLVAARLPITIAVHANTPALATGYATTRTVTILRRMPTVFLRGCAAPVRRSRDPQQESVTATRILRRVPNPGLPRQPVYTVAATVLLGVRVQAPDRATARCRAHDLLRAGLAGLRTGTLRPHVQALDITSVRRLGRTPSAGVRRHPATPRFSHPTGGDGQPHAA